MSMPMPGPRHRVLLLAGPSGSGKSHLARASGLPVLELDDFYRDADHPGLPRSAELGIVDWDHPDAWDADAALRAVDQLCRTGRAEVSVYDVRRSRTVGHRTLEVGDAPVFVAEGIFAARLIAPCRQRGLLVDAVVLDRSTWHNTLRRLARDLTERRKPVAVLLRRGWAQHRADTSVLRSARAQGARPASAAAVRALLRDAALGPPAGRP